MSGSILIYIIRWSLKSMESEDYSCKAEKQRWIQLINGCNFQGLHKLKLSCITLLRRAEGIPLQFISKELIIYLFKKDTVGGGFWAYWKISILSF